MKLLKPAPPILDQVCELQAGPLRMLVRYVALAEMPVGDALTVNANLEILEVLAPPEARRAWLEHMNGGLPN